MQVMMVCLPPKASIGYTFHEWIRSACNFVDSDTDHDGPEDQRTKTSHLLHEIRCFLRLSGLTEP